MLRAEGVSLSRAGAQSVHHVSLEVGDEEIVALIGPNGAGKTTLARIIAGLTPCDSGRVLVSSRENAATLAAQAARSGASAGISFIPAERHVFESLTVAENLSIGLFASASALSTHSEKRVKEFASRFPLLEARLQQQGGTLSGGERRVLSIARGIALLEASPAAEPRLMILDEPTLGLHVQTADAVRETIAGLPRAGISVLLVEQSARFALDLASWVYVMQRGSLVWDGPSDEAHDLDLSGLFLGTASPRGGATTRSMSRGTRSMLDITQ